MTSFETAKRFSDYLGFHIRALLFFTVASFFFEAAKVDSEILSPYFSIVSNSVTSTVIGATFYFFAITMWLKTAEASAELAIDWFATYLPSAPRWIVKYGVIAIGVCILLPIAVGTQSLVEFEVGRMFLDTVHVE